MGSNSPPATQDGSIVSNPTDSGKPTENLENLTAFERLFHNGPLPAQDTNELWGYIDSSGNWVISPSFMAARGFWSSGLALVQDAESQLWGMINASGQYVIEPSFNNIGNRISDDLFRVCVPERGWGYIDVSGAFVIEPQFDSANDFSNGFARVSSQIQFTGVDNQNYYQLWGYINTSGERITEDTFSEAQDFSDGLALIKQGDPLDGFYGYIDELGFLAIEPLYTEATRFNNGLAFVDMWVAGSKYYSLIDKDGNALTGPVSSKLVQPYFTKGLCCVRELDGTGYIYIDETGNTVLPKSGTPYADALNFTSDGLAVAVDSETMRAGYIDLDGNWAISPQYMQPGSFQNGLAFVIIDQNQTAIMDISGNLLVTLDGRAIVSSQSFRTPERILVNLLSSDGTGTYEKAGYCSAGEGLAIDYIYDAATDFAEDYSYAKAKYNGLWGIIDKDGNWLIPAQFLSLG